MYVYLSNFIVLITNIQYKALCHSQYVCILQGFCHLSQFRTHAHNALPTELHEH